MSELQAKLERRRQTIERHESMTEYMKGSGISTAGVNVAESEEDSACLAARKASTARAEQAKSDALSPELKSLLRRRKNNEAAFQNEDKAEQTKTKRKGKVSRLIFRRNPHRNSERKEFRSVLRLKNVSASAGIPNLVYTFSFRLKTIFRMKKHL